MSLDKKQVDLFLHELEGRGFNFQDKSYSEYGFNDEVLAMVFEMYEAGQQREGFKFVPVEHSKEMQQAAFDVYEVNDYKKYNLNSGTEVRDMIYKAMIEVV